MPLRNTPQSKATEFQYSAKSIPFKYLSLWEMFGAQRPRPKQPRLCVALPSCKPHPIPHTWQCDRGFFFPQGLKLSVWLHNLKPYQQPRLSVQASSFWVVPFSRRGFSAVEEEPQGGTTVSVWWAADVDKRGIDLLVSDALMHQPISSEMKRVEAIWNRQSENFKCQCENVRPLTIFAFIL